MAQLYTQSCTAFGELIVSPSECCAEWTRNSRRLNITVIRHNGMRSEPDTSIHFCPWCGQARHNEEKNS